MFFSTFFLYLITHFFYLPKEGASPLAPSAGGGIGGRSKAPLDGSRGRPGGRGGRSNELFATESRGRGGGIGGLSYELLEGGFRGR